MDIDALELERLHLADRINKLRCKKADDSHFDCVLTSCKSVRMLNERSASLKEKLADYRSHCDSCELQKAELSDYLLKGRRLSEFSRWSECLNVVFTVFHTEVIGLRDALQTLPNIVASPECTSNLASVRLPARLSQEGSRNERSQTGISVTEAMDEKLSTFQRQAVMTGKKRGRVNKTLSAERASVFELDQLGKIREDIFLQTRVSSSFMQVVFRVGRLSATST